MHFVSVLSLGKAEPWTPEGTIWLEHHKGGEVKTWRDAGEAHTLPRSPGVLLGSGSAGAGIGCWRRRRL